MGTTISDGNLTIDWCIQAQLNDAVLFRIILVYHIICCIAFRCTAVIRTRAPFVIIFLFDSFNFAIFLLETVSCVKVV